MATKLTRLSPWTPSFGNRDLEVRNVFSTAGRCEAHANKVKEHRYVAFSILGDRSRTSETTHHLTQRAARSHALKTCIRFLREKK